MVQNPDDVSGGSEQEEDSEMDQSGGLASRVFDSDEDDEGEDSTARALREGNARLRQMHSVDDEDDDGDGDDDDDDDEIPPPTNPRQAGGTMDQYLMPRAAGAKKATPVGLGAKPAAKRSSKPSEPSPTVRRTSSNGTSSKSKPKETQRTFTPHSDSDDDDDDDGPAMTTTAEQLRNPGVPLPAHDCMQEFEQQRTSNLHSGTQSDTAPKVHDSARSFFYAMKNEKTGRWWHVPSELFLYAPDNRKNAPFEFTLDDITITSTPIRKAMQKKLCDDSIVKMSNTAIILKLPVDGKLDGSLADAPGIVMAIPYTLKSAGTEFQDIRNTLAVDGKPVDDLVGLLALDREAVKTVYAQPQCPLPATYDPHSKSSTCTKWKHVSKLEDYFGKKDSPWDLNAQGVGKGSKGASKRSSETISGGGSSSKADGKRQATDGGSSAQPQPQPQEEEEVAHVIQENGIVSRWSGSMMKQFAHTCEPCAVSYMELSCDENQMFTLVKAGPGKWVLLKCLES